MKNILEIGCGQGFNSYSLSKHNRVTGIDLSENEILIAKKRYPKVDFRIMNAGNLTFEDNYFDEIYAIDILEHVNSLDSVLREVNRTLKEGGKFFINVPAEKSEKWLLALRPSYFEEMHHVRIFRNNDLVNLLKSKGFRVISKKKKGFLQHLELYFLFKRNSCSSNQLGIGNWRDNLFTKTIHLTLLFFDPIILKTPLKYFPIYIFTLPLGLLINLVGSALFPKSFYYEFKKI